ncbi:MAG: RNA polymerase sigma factor, partial [Gemmatimonadales bacterium]
MTSDRSGPGSAADAADARRASAGDQSAFERLYRRHVPRIHSLARRMVGPDDADEATQDVFVRAWHKLDTFRGDAAFGTWLYRLAVNQLLGRRAAQGRERQRLVGGERVLEQRPGRARHPELAMDFEAAIAELPDGARRVFVLHDV